jgi:hypothetical protein
LATFLRSNQSFVASRNKIVTQNLFSPPTGNKNSLVMPEIKMEDATLEGGVTGPVDEQTTVEADNPEDTWDEERLQKALDTLKEMYIQVTTPHFYPG